MLIKIGIIEKKLHLQSYFQNNKLPTLTKEKCKIKINEYETSLYFIFYYTREINFFLLKIYFLFVLEFYRISFI